MSNSLSSHLAKLGRAQTHLNLLHDMMGLLHNSGVYAVYTERDPETGDVVIYGEARREPPTSEWGVVIGDIVHNLRSALDHMVWQLTLTAGHLPPLKISGKWRKTVFPVFMEDPRRKDESENRIPWQVEPPESLWGIQPRLIPEFERLQPFMRGADADFTPLAILHHLWNIDKHRYFHLAHFRVGRHEIFGPPPLPKVPGIEHLRFAPTPKGPFEGRTQLGRLSGAKGHVPPELDQYIQPTAFFDIAFEDGPPAYGGQVAPILNGLFEEVRAILQRFQHHFE